MGVPKGLQMASAPGSYLLPIFLRKMIETQRSFRVLRHISVYLRDVMVTCESRRFTDLLSWLYHVRESGRKAQVRVFAVISVKNNSEMTTVSSGSIYLGLFKSVCNFN